MLVAAVIAAFALQAASLSTPEAEIGAVLDQLNVASTEADTETYFGLYTPDARFIGTDRNERWTIDAFRAYAAPVFASGKGWTYVPSDRVITVADIDCRCVAWFDEQLSNTAYGATRGSGVLRLTSDGWKIEQYVLSFAVPNEASKAVVAAIAATPASTQPSSAAAAH